MPNQTSVNSLDEFAHGTFTSAYYSQKEEKVKTLLILTGLAYYFSGSLPANTDPAIQTEDNFISNGSAFDVALTQEIEKYLERIISFKINIPNPSEVRHYLLKYNDMTDLTYFVCQITRKMFDYDTQLSLEVFHDPEIEDETLTLYVRQEDYEEDITEKIEELDEEYGEMLMDKTGYLLVMTDFQKPR